MKKRASLLLVLLAGLALAACGEQESASVLTLSTAAPATTQAGAASQATAASATTAAPKAQVTKNPNQPPERPANGYTAPDFTLKSLTGEEVTLSQFRGKPVLINFWATWCPPCKYELPLLQKTHETYKDQLVMLGVDVAEELSVVRLKVREFSLTYTNLLDSDRKVTSLYRVSAYPTSFFLDKDGVIRQLVSGAVNEETIQPYLDKILK